MTRIYLFEKHFKEICPEKLQSKKENVSCTKASFFDINLEIKDNHISTKIYDERDSFPFEVPFMPFFNSNVRSKISYSSIGFEILLFTRNVSDHLTFITLVNKLLNRVSKQGSQQRNINKGLCPLPAQHHHEMISYDKCKRGRRNKKIIVTQL